SCFCWWKWVRSRYNGLRLRDVLKMVLEFKYTKQVDPYKLHKQIENAGFNILGVMYDEGMNMTTVMLDDSETNDPTSIVDTYTYVEPVYPNYPVLYANAQNVVNNALVQYNSAVTSYVAALTSWNNAGATITTGNALVKLAANEAMVTACATAIEAAKNAIVALVEVVTVLAKNSNVVQEEE
ncbi:MAG: hypothetical protein PHN69_04090, partial [Candidatus Pacebacteria bacterium]|nr:hypothetical protein [Candidatus Paceibacterota bacterium]